MIRPFVSLAVALGATAAAPTPASAPVEHPSAAQLVAARQAGMHMAATLLYGGILAKAKAGGDIKDRHEAEGIELWAAAIPGLFPSGSAHPESRARPEIWSARADFAAKAAALGAAAVRLGKASEANDRAVYAAEADHVRLACASCHDAYRSE